ncbi:PREDICTED: uncharacterized protein LOC109146914 [Ipomoea nil]|uniref:uncharacterized protein LOC109146914 n=1 Tax=Ipomoea nil TaxID=35883 RepID=UPI000901B1EB|nr:PREDICTED: uncharacterized protein LOC109146914 [Ipomoea nil]
MLRALGFDSNWIALVMLCVTTVNYSILVNGVAAGHVRPTRGIRQGDPLSPYLFILCAEGLSILLQQAEAWGDIHGVRVARGAPAISHLFFADDSLLFFRANQREAVNIKQCLDLYSLASGQLINFDKSNAVYSHNTPGPTRDLVTGIVGVQEAPDLGRYLGLPSALGRNKTAVFKYIEENIRARIGLWQHMFLSRAGKKGWRLLTQPDSLVSRILKAKYFATVDFMEAQVGGNPSFIWRSIMAGRAVLEQGLARRIGDGTETRIWGWNWLADASNKPLITLCVEELRHATVIGLLDEHGRWDGDILRDIFHSDDIPRILATPVSTHLKDCWRWPGDLRGKYTVQNGYRLLARERVQPTVDVAFHAWKTLWAAQTPPK